MKMKNYSKKIDERVNNPKNFGEITKQEAQSLGCKLVVADFESNGNDTLRVYFAITKDKIVFCASCHFPTMQNDTANESKVFFSLEDAKEFVSERWNFFLTAIS